MADVKRFVNNFLWKFLERCGSQGVTLIVSIILARLIAPEAYGIMSIVYVFTSILNVFVDSGMGVALVQKKNADDVDFSSVFYFNLVFGGLLYALMYVLSPLIASFYKMPELVSVLRVASLILIISGLRNVQQAYVSKNLLFKKFFYATLGGVIVSAAIALYLAYTGWGIWALVVQSLTNLLVSTIILWIVVRWRPKLLFSFARLKELIRFGWKLLITGLMDILYEDLRVLIIGKMYKPSDLAYYNMGAQVPYSVVNNINTSIDSVFFPTVSEAQEDKDQVKRMLRRSLITSTYIMAPLMLCLVAMTDSIVPVILTEKWVDCIIYLKIFCFVFLFYPLNSSNLNVIKALGRSDIVLKVETVKKILGVASVLITMWISPLAMAVGMLVCALIGQVLNAWPNKALLNYSYWDQIRDILPNIALAAATAFLISLVSLLGLSDLYTLIIQAVSAVLIYFLLSKLFKVNSLEYLRGVVGLFFKRQ